MRQNKYIRLGGIMCNSFQVIGKNLKYYREKKGYTQEELAEKANISVSHLSKIETGKRTIGMKAYLNILQILEITDMNCIMDFNANRAEKYFQRYQSLMADCDEGEQRFLINTLETLKENMKILKTQSALAV